MKVNNYYETYPMWIPLLSNLVSLTIYGIGAFIHTLQDQQALGTLPLGIKR